MKRSIALVAVIAAILLLDGCVTAPTNPAFEAGKAQAQEDIANGILAIEHAGFPMRYDGEYVRLLKHRYGFELRRVAYCVVHEEVEEHMRGYNKIAHAEIGHRFGEGCLSKTMQEAEASYETNNRAK
jgi:hypothetical protein